MNTGILMIFIIIFICFIYISYMYANIPTRPNKIIVFDMDETLGCFVQLGIFIHILESHIHRQITSQEFNIFMDMFPLYQRPNIIGILHYLKKQKQQGKCNKIYIYTNNQGPKSWSLLIKQYFEYKLNYPLFDKVIHAYKVNNIQVEKNRTTHNKTIKDFLNCTNLSKNIQICFLDDQYHPHMLNPNVYYLHLKEYHYYYEPTYMFQKFKDEFQLSDNYISYLQNSNESVYLDYQENKQHMLLSNEKKVSKKILEELKYFIHYFGKPLTRKAKYKQNYTKKKYTQRHPYKQIH
jgi:hypothetical protein